MKVFIDSSIPSEFLKGNLSSENESYLETVLFSNEADKCEVITISSIKEKINRIPELNKSQNNRVLLLLKGVDEVEENGYCAGLKAGSIGGYEAFNSTYEKLINILDNLEARQIYQSISHKCDYYLTINKSIFKKTDEISEIKIVSPKELSKIIVNKSHEPTLN